MKQFEITQSQLFDIENPYLGLDDYPFDDVLIDFVMDKSIVEINYFGSKFLGYISHIEVCLDRPKCNLTFLICQRISG
jgi:hypothetical protein